MSDYMVVLNPGGIEVVEIPTETTEIIEVATPGPPGPPGVPGEPGINLWGSIEGDLADQPDLKLALDSRELSGAADEAIAAHEATYPHDQFASRTEAQGYAASAESDAKDYTDQAIATLGTAALVDSSDFASATHTHTAIQVGADPVGTAASAIAAHEAEYNHGQFVTETELSAAVANKANLTDPRFADERVPLNGSVSDLKIGDRTAAASTAPINLGPGSLTQWLGWIVNRINAITGVSWPNSPSITLEAAATAIANKQNLLGFTPENLANKAQPSGYASLGSDGKVPSAQLPTFLANSAGSSGELQFNNAGAFGASNSLFWSTANSRLGIGTNTPGSNLQVSGGLLVSASTSAGTDPGAGNLTAGTIIANTNFSSPGSGGTSNEKFGAGAAVSASNAIAIGTSCSVSGSGSLAIGPSLTVSAADSVVIGSGASTSGNFSVVIGRQASASSGTNVVIGQAASCTNSASVAIGRQASAASNAVAVGSNTAASGVGSVVIGRSSTASNSRSIAIGNGNSSTHIDSITLGGSATSTANYQFVLGGSATVNASQYTSSWWGKGVASAGPPSSFLFSGTGGEGIDIAGTALIIQGGLATGSAVSGDISLRTGTAGSSGSTAQTATDRMVIKAGGRIVQAALNSIPADADLANGQIAFYLDEATNELKVKTKYSGGAVRTGVVATLS